MLACIHKPEFQLFVAYETDMMCACVRVCVPVCARLVSKSCLNLCDPIQWGPPGSSVYGISLQEYCKGVPFSSAGDIHDPGIKLASLMPPGRQILYH